MGRHTKSARPAPPAANPRDREEITTWLSSD